MNTQLSHTTIDYTSLLRNSNNNILSPELESKLVDKLKSTFTIEEQQMYIANLYMYINYHQTKEYPINLDNVWKYLGFANKANSKRTLVNNFIVNDDYKIQHGESLLFPKDEQKSTDKRGGHNEETIMLNIDTFKSLCMLSKTENGKKIRKYYTKLESINNEIIKEQMQQSEKKMKEQLEEKEKEIKEKTREIEKLKTISKKGYYYIYKINDTKYKLGICSSLEETLQTYRRNSSNTCFEWTYEFNNVNNARICENIIKALLANYREKTNEKTEVFNLDITIIKEVVNVVLEYFDNIKLTNEEQLKEFLKKFKETKKEIKQIIKEEIKNEIGKTDTAKSVKVTITEKEKQLIKNTINKLYEKTNENVVCTKDFYDSIYNELKNNHIELQEKLQYTKPKNSKTGCMGYTKKFADAIRDASKDIEIRFKESKVKNEKSGFYLKNIA